MDQLPFVVAGILVGFVVGLTGMGGGALMTPILVLLGIPASTAVGTDLAVSLVMKPVGGGVHLKKKTVNLDLVKWLVVGSVPSAFVSVWAITTFVSGDLDTYVQYAIGAALLLASVALVAKGAFSGRVSSAPDALDHVAVKPLPTLCIGIFGGVMVGITSVGSGSLMMVLMLILYPTITSRQLVGTDLVQAIPLVGSAALAHMVFGTVDVGLGLALVVGAVPGVYVGAHVSSRAPDYVIRPILASVLVISGLKMLEEPVGLDPLLVSAVGFVLVAVALGVIVRAHARRPAAAVAPAS